MKVSMLKNLLTLGNSRAVALPKAWLEAMKLTEERAIQIQYDDETQTIVIKKLEIYPL